MTEDKAPEVLGVIISMLALGGIFVFARTITRTFIKPAFGWDDALIIATWFIILGYNTAMFVSISRGYGKHIVAMTMPQYSSVVHAEIIGQVFAIAAFPSGKASIAVLLTRLFPGKILRWSVWIVVALNAFFFYIDAILIVVQCQPAAYQWDRTIPGGKCWDAMIVTNWGVVTGAVGAFTDFAFAIIPWFYIYKLQMALRERIIIGIALSLGLFAGACSVLKIYYTETLTSRSDYAFDTIPLVEWSCVELAFINVSACIPTLRPLYQLFAGKQGPRTLNTSAYGTGGSGFSSRRHERHDQLGSHNDDRNIYQMKTFEFSYAENTSPSPEAKMHADNRSGRESDDARLL